MPAPVSSEPFKALATSLKGGGFAAHGDRLQGVLDGVWTTSSEMIGELGTVVLAIRKECRPLTAEQRGLVNQCLREVRKAFPGFGWFHWGFF
jgi:hypothetical protein